LPGQQEGLLSLLVEAEVYDGSRAQGHSRRQRGCARPSPRAGQHGGVPAVIARAQEGRDAVRSYEAHLQTRSPAAARPERRQGRGAAHRNGAEPTAARQAAIPSSASAGRWLRVSVAEGRAPLVLQSFDGRAEQTDSRMRGKANSQKFTEFRNTIWGEPDHICS